MTSSEMKPSTAMILLLWLLCTPSRSAVGGSSRPAGSADHNAAAKSGYVIVTTEEIKSRSSELMKFMGHKTSRGFQVHLITQMDFGGGAGDVAAENIRAWLHDHYLVDNIRYVLMLGDPHPATGQIPMKMVYTAPWSKGIPSDYYYADLNSMWDLNGDGRYGEWPNDFGPGGVDMFAEVLVGRIPFYGSITDLDAILRKTVRYEKQSGKAIQWRKNALLVMHKKSSPAFSEGIKDRFLAPAGWSCHRLYDKDFGLTPPPETVPATKKNVIDVWSRGRFGLAVWWGHGGSTTSYAINSDQVGQLNDEYPSFTVQLCCRNAPPEVRNNLAYSLLKHGAISTFAATRSAGRMSWLGRDYVARLVTESLSAGEAMYETKAWQFGVGWNTLAAFNLYGDASVRIIPSTPRSRRRFVNTRAVPGGDGRTWKTAYKDLQDALGGIVRPDMVREIWVAAGTYKPDRSTGDRGATFRFDKGVEIYGGFSGAETGLNQRDLSKNVTVLSGDIGVRHDRSDNSYHVITFKDTHVGAALDGFIIAGGNANGTRPADRRGGGLVSRNSNPILSNCVFVGNSAADTGGAISSSNKWNILTLTNCIFAGNLGDKGGAIGHDAKARIVNCTFAGNSAGRGGAIYNHRDGHAMQRRSRFRISASVSVVILHR